MEQVINAAPTDESNFLDFLFEEYDEKLETECIMRARSIFDEFVCPDTGTILVCTFAEYLNGIDRLWSLAQEMKGLTQEIHERLINLPFLFILVLLKFIENEYAQEDHEKTPADPILEESLLKTFLDMHSKQLHFKPERSQRVLLNTCLMFLRHLLTTLGADRQIKRLKWSEINVKRLEIVSPIRNTDLKLFLECLRQFKKEILPVYSKRQVSFVLIFVNRYPEPMEPTLELQSSVSNIMLTVSVWLIALSILVLGISSVADLTATNPEDPASHQAVDDGKGPGNPEIVAPTLNYFRDLDNASRVI